MIRQQAARAATSEPDARRATQRGFQTGRPTLSDLVIKGGTRRRCDLTNQERPVPSLGRDYA